MNEWDAVSAPAEEDWDAVSAPAPQKKKRAPIKMPSFKRFLPLLGIALLLVLSGGGFWAVNNHVINLANSSAPAIAQPAVPVITSVSPISTAQYQTIIISGHGFGTLPPLTNSTSGFLSISDNTDGGWDIGCPSCYVTINVSARTDSRIVITGFSGEYSKTFVFKAGDELTISVWDAQTDAGPATFNVIVK